MATNGQTEEVETIVTDSTGLSYEKRHLGFHNVADSIDRLLIAERQDSDAERNDDQGNSTTQNGNHSDETILVAEERDDSSEVLVISEEKEGDENAEQNENETTVEGLEEQNVEEIVVMEDSIEPKLVLVDEEETENDEDKADPKIVEELEIEGEQIPAEVEEQEIEERQLVVESSDPAEQVLVSESQEVDTQEIDEDETATVRPAVINTLVAEVPYIELVNGRLVPIIGLGTWLIRSEVLHEIISTAVDIGYRHFDCAHVYQNEEAVGEALRAKIEEGTVSRQELFITSKLWATHHKPDVVETACRKTLEALGLDYLDLYLMHTPFGFKDGKTLLPKIAGVLQYSSYDYLETWYAMEELVKKGLVRSIGVANFNSEQITRLCSKAKIMPVINQVECHPYLNQKKLTELCRSKGIAICAYGALGSPPRRQMKSGGEPTLLENERIISLSEKYGVNVTQILLRYQVEKENILVPRTSNLEHLQENMDIFNFSLEPEDFEELDNMKRTKRYTDFVGMGETHKYYPFNILF